jgi:hypothetical protein
MATKYGIRNYSRSGNTVTFTVVALNADGTVDTAYTGGVTFGLVNFSNPGAYTFVAGDLGQRTFTANIIDPNVRAGLAAIFPGAGTGANLSVSSNNGTNTSFGNQGDHLVVGGTGNDTYGGNVGNDTFLFQQGGNDTANGGGGNDGVYFGAAFNSGDSVNGGAGTDDQVALQGDYSASTTLQASQLSDVETIALLAGNDTRFGDLAGNSYDYDLSLTGAWAGVVTFNMGGLRAGEDAAISAAATTGGAFRFFAGAGRETLTGGVEDDGFFFSPAALQSTDVVDGGGGLDNQVGLRGDFSGGYTFGAAQLSNIQTIVLISSQDFVFPSATPFSYTLTLNDGNVTGANRLTVTGGGLRSNESMIVNGSAETSGTLRLIGGAGDDTLTGGAGNDIIFGGLGLDQLEGRGGSDIFVFTSTAESTGAGDLVLEFDQTDLIDLSAIDADVNTPGHQSFTFIGSAAFSGVAGQVRFDGAILFRVYVDTDGDSSADMAIQLASALPTLTPSDFIGVI